MVLTIREHFPPKGLLETPAVLRALVAAHRHLAELKGVARSIPNERLLVSTLSLQEAQSSSEIENIITTQDALYRYQVQPGSVDPAGKEVAWYAQSLEVGFQEVRASGLLRLSTILKVQATLEGNDAGLRRTPGTVLKNERSGEVVYEPPSPEQLPALMDELVSWIHADTDAGNGLDPLVRMAVMHHQFETIHPFYDGNGRTGRILNILFLVRAGLLDSPILYLSRYISQTKAEYYAGLRKVRDSGEWEGWLLYLLRGIAVTARHTTALVEQIARLLQKQKHGIRAHYRFYSQDLINNIFYHPYTKVAFVEQDLGVSRATASRYLDELDRGGILDKHRLGRENYYINRELVQLLFNLPPLDMNTEH
ncbi:Fic family protein [Nitrosococcus wardiae]|uniref:Protein adenylyltransferase n=1 Tax=Nitrosococcus wardiae TaxID=1814290 RepID=A0A4P7C3G1_9GAMM|nr:Fic family protein [Nitrosococcus wardiae]QBQ55456.1 Fic family protein [Nitrosococcus wardiae]